ncbi:amidohydrolase family protein [Sediminispirochaeta smaragdinae]|uniref:Amidohydrolase n=1 Tax=Sediminispirochaeta smaragdinae (strain DSM 11293 / JCM 15392 / SEBR 4228) TaxID=573413 RepID=E1RB05_SEDSS|nr:amidohydrolase [Sediminispirochaeta smaragdinae]ADK79535.1 amidohydrolase [Sediminispirochaeta smaragdinae DSM 11293]
MANTVIKGGFLMLEEGIRKAWGVRVEGHTIVQVGPNESLTVSAGDKYIDATDKLIAPGFINGHMHMYGVLSHGISADAVVTDFTSFLEDFWWPYVENRIDHRLVEITTKWACVEMIKSGITTFMEVLEGPNSVPGALDIEKRVVESAGLRGILSFEACERISPENGQVGLKENIDFARNNNKAGSLVQGMISIHTLFTAGKEYIMQAKKAADELGCGIHMHLSESVYEPNWVMEKYGKRPVELYDEWGYLGPHVLASQGVQMSPKEIDILAERGVRVVHMPLSNCEVGGGVAPIPRYLEKGVTTGLGTDGYVNNFFEVMRGAFLIHKAYHQDPQVMPAAAVYDTATAQGARAMGRDDIGTIKEGALADIITIGLDTPTPINEKNVYDQLILFRNPEDVCEVMVNGVLLKEQGKLLTLDEAAIKDELREATETFWTFS